MKDVLENGLERTIFTSRWILAPVYLGLVVAVGLVVVKFFGELWHLVADFSLAMPADEVTVKVLSLIDIALLANLILIVVFAGYENFVSKISVAEDSEDRPTWMGHVDFSGLKMKLIGSLVAISVILLLKDFVAAADPLVELDYHAVGWRVALHFTFVISGLIFAIMDYWGAKRLKLMADMHRDDAAGTPDAELYDPKAV